MNFCEGLIRSVLAGMTEHSPGGKRANTLWHVRVVAMSDSGYLHAGGGVSDQREPTLPLVHHV